MNKKDLSVFELEQSLFECWHTKEDLENLYHRMDAMTQDQIANYLLGLIEIHNTRCEKTFDIYETLLQQRKLKYG